MDNKAAITTAEWWSELQRLSEHSDDGLTSEEWAQAMRVSQRSAMGRIKQGIHAGLLKHGWRPAVSIDGRHIRVSVYRVVGGAASMQGGVA